MGIIKKIRNDVALNCSRVEGGIMPLDYSALVIVELLPLLKELKMDDDAPVFQQMIAILEHLAIRIRKHNYSKDAILLLVKTEYLADKDVYALAEIIGSNAYCIFPTGDNEPMFFKSISKCPPVLRSDYGDEAYNPLERAEDDPNPEIPKNEHIMEVRAMPNEKLCDAPEIVALKKKYNELAKPNEKYFWQWRVATEDYDEFKDLLMAVDFSERKTEKIRECANQLCFYIAEWYKREYDGNESDNCLKELGIEGKAKTIWEGTHPDGEQPYITEEKQHEWLYSIYVLGGFPIKYTLRAKQFSSLFDEIWGEDQNLDVISDEQIDELTRGFNGNQVVKNNLISGSLHDYYRYLRMSANMPIASSDTDKDPFASFVRKLQEGKKNYYEQYLKPTWLLYVDSDDSYIDGAVQVTFGRKDDRCYIPMECLSYWRISEASTLDGFEIEVVASTSGEKESVHFSKTGPGDYPFVGWSRHNKITIPVAIDEDDRIEVYLVTTHNRYQIGDTYSFDDSRQFYKTNQPYEWSSRTDNSAHTAVLFNPAKFPICDSSSIPAEKIFREGGSVWKWLLLSEKISLVTESGDTICYAPRNSSLEIVFSLIPNTIKYVNFRDIVHHQFVDGEHVQTAVTLLLGKGFSVRYTPYGSDEPKDVSLKCSVFYKKPGDNNRFIAWDETNRPKQGLVLLKVKYNDKGVSSTKLVYYLPQSDSITRITDNNLILFSKEIEDVYAPGSEQYMPLRRNEEGHLHYYDDIVNGYSPQSDTIPFLFGTPDEDYVIINIYRSAKCKEIYLKDVPDPVKRYDQSHQMVDIPVILRRHFDIRTINAAGVKRVKCGADVYLDYRLPLYNNKCIDDENGLCYYVAKDKYTITNDEFVTFAVDSSPVQYLFLYWSMQTGEEPVPLEHKSFDPETNNLVIDISPLRKHNRGIVFQSLKNVIPRQYFTPIYGAQKSSSYERRGTLIQCFNVASEYNIPFALFEGFQDIFSKEDVPYYLSHFWVELMIDRHWNPTSRDYASLHRFAYEFLFDWIMLPKRKWFNNVREWRKHLVETGKDYVERGLDAPYECMLKLFRTTPYVFKDDKGYLEKVIEMYRTFTLHDWKFRRTQQPDSILAQCIRGAKGDYSCFDNDHDKRIDNLRNLHANKTLFEGLYRLMTRN